MPGLNEDTALAEALDRDERVYDRLAAAAPAYRKFAKALMREDTAGRLTLRDIANMAGLNPTEVVRAAEGSQVAIAADTSPLQEGPPFRASDPNGEWPRFDAIPLLIGGHEPLAAILDFTEQLPSASSFIVEATFHPQPLRRLFEGRGYETAAESIAVDHWRIFFRHRASAS